MEYERLASLDVSLLKYEKTVLLLSYLTKMQMQPKSGPEFFYSLYPHEAETIIVCVMKSMPVRTFWGRKKVNAR